MDVCDPGEIHTSFHPHLSSPRRNFCSQTPSSPLHFSYRPFSLSWFDDSPSRRSNVHKCKVYHPSQYDIIISAASNNILTSLFTPCLHSFLLWSCVGDQCLVKIWKSCHSTLFKPSSELACMRQTVCFALWASPWDHLWMWVHVCVWNCAWKWV